MTGGVMRVINNVAMTVDLITDLSMSASNGVLLFGAVARFRGQ